MAYNINETYWASKGKYQKVYDVLSKKIPPSYLTGDDSMDLVIVVGNLYYDLYNNGLCNKENHLVNVRKYMDMFKDEIKNNIENKPDFTKVYNGVKNFEAFENVFNAIIKISIDSAVTA